MYKIVFSYRMEYNKQHNVGRTGTLSIRKVCELCQEHSLLSSMSVTS